MADQQESPRKTSSDYDLSSPYWTMVCAILGGAERLRAVPGQSVPGPAQAYSNLSQLDRGRFAPESPYLPQFPNELPQEYERRRKHAPLDNIYSDISRNLSSKPFSKTLELADDVAEDLKNLSENIDGQGNNLHVFGRCLFKDGIDKGIDWILVDYTKVKPGTTLAAERQMGARPYWVHISPERLLAVYSRFVNGSEVIFHARIHEPCTEVVGFSEVTYDRVRVIDRQPIIDANDNIVGFQPATWTVYEMVEKEENGGKAQSWIVKDQGALTIGIIPLVPFITGNRSGTSWYVEPPLRDLAYMQIEEFQQESNLKTAKNMTAFPMLAGNGVPPPTDTSGQQIEVPVGPHAVLFAPPNSDGQHGEWKFIEPSASSLTFLQSDLDKLRNEMRELGMQPLAAANLTVVTTANISLKAHNTVQAWALALKDALELAWKYTAMWLGQKVEPEVNIHVDFGVELEAGPELDALNKAEIAGTISKRLYFNELKRRGVLSDDADWEEDQQQQAEEQQGQDLQGEQPIDPATGQPIVMQPPQIRQGVPQLQ